MKWFFIGLALVSASLALFHGEFQEWLLGLAIGIGVAMALIAIVITFEVVIARLGTYWYQRTSQPPVREPIGNAGMPCPHCGQAFESLHVCRRE